MKSSSYPFTSLLLVVSFSVVSVHAQTLEEDLKQLAPATLADLAHRDGDAARGAVLFFQPSLACSKCHATDGNPPTGLGPSLVQVSGAQAAFPAPADSAPASTLTGEANINKALTDEAIIEAILEPSRSIRPGFEAVSVLTQDGLVMTGLLVERTEAEVVLRDSSGIVSRIAMADVEQVSVHPQSIMPAGQVNQLTSRQQFLDMLKYLYEIRDGGPQRARELQPAESLLALQLPDYEARIDHAGFMRDWNEESLQRGEAIYQRVCANCHGTHEQPGSLPTSLRFAEGKFKNGSDPLSMYGTLTRGFGFMAAQTWMVPSQKYDVIHYIREAYLKPHNAAQLTEVTTDYLASLPSGDARGPEPSNIEVWSAMDYGTHLTHCYEVPGESLNIAYKGIAIRLDPGAGGVARGAQWMLFDTDTLRAAAGWHTRDAVESESAEPSERFIDWRDIQMNGQHGIHPRIVGDIVFRNGNGPGWAEPNSGTWSDDQRVEGRDGRRYGPLPRPWGRFRGLYHYGNKVLLSYQVGTTDVLELPNQVTFSSVLSSSVTNNSAPASDGSTTAALVRTFHVGPRDQALQLQVAELGADSIAIANDSRGLQGPDYSAVATRALMAGVLTKSPLTKSPLTKSPLKWSEQAGRLCITLPAGPEPLEFNLWLTKNVSEEATQADLLKLSQRIEAELAAEPRDLQRFTQGGPARWGQRLETQLTRVATEGPLAVERITAPEANPWLAQLRFSGIDFFADGSLAACTWDGDVWHVRIDETRAVASWQRIASGLYQPLGLKIIDEKVHLTCRDQLTVLHDLNGDGETDYYECLNNDHQVTEHFHEFAMGLQVDEAGDFYYAKSGRHALEAVVPHHGTLLRVSRDGSKTDILATGFRAANGVCLNPDGSFLVTDQEGFWNPKNRINWVTLNPDGGPKFYGNMFGYHDVTDSSDAAMEPPLCWITNQFDRSPGELLWIDSPSWRAFEGGLLNLSYGTGKVFLVLQEEVQGVRQGGMIELPIPTFPTGVMRGRFSPVDHDLWLCGMFAWAGDATQPGGLYRMRATDRPMNLPIQLQATTAGLYLTFAETLDPQSISPAQVAIKSWDLKRTRNYGSQHYNERPLPVRTVELLANGRTVRIQADELQPTWCMEIQFDFKTQAGDPARGVIHNTIHRLGVEVEAEVGAEAKVGLEAVPASGE